MHGKDDCTKAFVTISTLSEWYHSPFCLQSCKKLKLSHIIYEYSVFANLLCFFLLFMSALLCAVCCTQEDVVEVEEHFLYNNHRWLGNGLLLDPQQAVQHVG
jgi:hypothetical protein